MDLNELKKLINEEVKRTRQRNILKEQESTANIRPKKPVSDPEKTITTTTQKRFNPALGAGGEQEKTIRDKPGDIGRYQQPTRQAIKEPTEGKPGDLANDPRFASFDDENEPFDVMKQTGLVFPHPDEDTHEPARQAKNPDLDRILADPKALAYIKQKLGLDIPQQYIPKDTGDKTVR